MTAKLLLLLAIIVALLGQGCRPATSRQAPSGFITQISKLSPSGWQVAASSDMITLRRDAPVWIMGYISRQPQFGTKEEFFRRVGTEIHYELRLRFVPLLSRREYKSLKAARTQAAARLKQGASGKSEYVELQQHYEECQVPLYFTEHYSIFVDRWADISADTSYLIEPLFVEVYPPEAASEINAVVKSFGHVFKKYDNPDT